MCVCERELVASVVSGLLLLQVSVGADIEKTAASSPDTLLIPPYLLGASTPRLFCFAFSFEPLPNGMRPEETATFFPERLLLRYCYYSRVSTSCSLIRSLVLAFILILSVFSLSDQATDSLPTPLPLPPPCLIPSSRKHATIFAVQYMQLWIAKQVEK